MNILIVDDHPENLYLLESLFSGKGHTLLSASNGAEALELLESNRIDLIISDILMPVMDGFELCRKVKTHHVYRSIPLIIYTATYTGHQDEAFALKIGADRFLEKPCEPDVLLRVIDDVISAARQGSAPPSSPALPEAEALKLYNERLVRKLEQKVLEAENEIKSRRDVEEALRESEARFRQFADTAPVGVIITDHDHNAVYVSQSLVAMFGYTQEEIRTMDDWMRRAYPDDGLRSEVREKWIAAVDEARRTKSVIVPQEYPVTCKDGLVREIEFRMSTSDKLDFIVVTDISERKRAETERERLREQLFQAQKMESVGRLAGGVAHDFNNMLSVILGYSEMAMSRVRHDDPLHKDLEEIHNAALRSAEITRQLLAFARKQTVAPRVLDLNGAIEGMLNMLRRLIGADIELLCSPDISPCLVRIDPSQVDQILVNLCVNARDAVSNGGRISIRTGTATLDSSICARDPTLVPGVYIFLQVSDNGCGMDRETLDRLFEPFFTTKGHGKGTGLGMPTVYGIVKQNEGFIDVQSEPGKGSTFTVYLPRHSGEAEQPELDGTAGIPKGRGETILVVEDESAILQLATSALEQLGYDVLKASTPGGAIAIAASHAGQIHLLLTDVVMPEMNGRELAAKLTSDAPSMKVIFMSGYEADVLAHQDISDGGPRFIPKPFSIAGLAAEVRAALDRV